MIPILSSYLSCGTNLLRNSNLNIKKTLLMKQNFQKSSTNETSIKQIKLYFKNVIIGEALMDQLSILIRL